MQNRRLYADDAKGVGEPLNEQDKSGNGMRVKSSYYLQFIHTDFHPNSMRMIQ